MGGIRFEMANQRWYDKVADWLPEPLKELLSYVWVILVMGLIRWLNSLFGIEPQKAEVLADIHFVLSCILLIYLGLSVLLRRIKKDFSKDG